ncbi:MAG: hypothetical protein K0Q52_3238 [Microbacterium sp.]|nr:hypothetical protein [Microbacterium sp.]
MTLWASFWDIIWWFLAVFVLFAYLFALFAIITDLFRDRTLNGWGKAAWLIFLIFVPFLTALIYLIARGGGMAERGAREAQATRSAADEYIKSVADSSPSDEIAKARALFDAGTITAAEFELIKTRALAG